MKKWGMVIDLKRCIGCWACFMACRSKNFLPRGVHWNRVITGESGKYPTVRKEMYPVLCNHCADAACVDVCPTGATSKREDGIVQIDYDKCIGCRTCLLACPYQQRTYFDGKDVEYYPGQGLTPFEELGRQLKPLKKGTVVKCNFCVDRIESGIDKRLVPGEDEAATPACVNACPTEARVFGDLNDPNSNVCNQIKRRSGYQLHPEFETNPSVYYLPA